MITFNKLFQFLAEHGISQKELAEKSGISYPTISRLRTNSNTGLATIEAICTALNCKPEDIMEYTPIENSTPPFSH